MEFLECGQQPAPEIISPDAYAGSVEFGWLTSRTSHTLTYRVVRPARRGLGPTVSSARRLPADNFETFIDTLWRCCVEIGDCCVPHQADQNGRLEHPAHAGTHPPDQFYNLRSLPLPGRYRDGYAPGVGDTACAPTRRPERRLILQLSPETHPPDPVLQQRWLPLRGRYPKTAMPPVGAAQSAVSRSKVAAARSFKPAPWQTTPYAGRVGDADSHTQPRPEELERM